MPFVSRWLTPLLVCCLAVACLVARPAADARAALAPLSVRGNQLLRGGSPWRFEGVTRDSLEWGRHNWDGCGGDQHFTSTDFHRIRAWGADVVRFTLSEADWLGRACSAGKYRRLVTAAVNRANAAGLYVILDLHWADVGGRAPCGGGCLSGQQPMPDRSSIQFWSEVARAFANRSGVLFELFNEPHLGRMSRAAAWSCWRDGGCSVHASPSTVRPRHPVSYRAVGMQELLDAVRAAGAGNLVLAQGLQWGYDLSRVSSYPLQGSGVVYATHVYTRWHHTVADWNAAFGRLDRHVVVVATEFGSTDCTPSDTRRLLRYFGARDMSWTIWGWSAPGSCSQPSVLATWSGLPLGGQGVLIHHALQLHAHGANG